MNNSPAKRPLLSWIFLSPGEPRLRAGWRLLIQLIMMGAIGFFVLLLTRSVISQATTSTVGMLISQVATFIIVTPSVVAARIWLDRRSIKSLGLAWDTSALADLLVGILLAALMFALLFAAEWAAGWLTFDGFAWEEMPASVVITELIAGLIIFIFVGWNEELLSRGYWLQNLIDGLNPFWAVLLSSLFFGLAHLNNPNATWVGALGTGAAGALLAFCYLRTRRLWLPIGLHIGWNYFEGTIFGFPVSGLGGFSLVQQTQTGPEAITGGAFGPEAGWVVLPAMLLIAVLVYYYRPFSRPESQLQLG